MPVATAILGWGRWAVVRALCGVPEGIFRVGSRVGLQLGARRWYRARTGSFVCCGRGSLGGLGFLCGLFLPGKFLCLTCLALLARLSHVRNATGS